MREFTMNDINIIIDTVCNGMYHIDVADVYDGPFQISKEGHIVRAVESVSYDRAQIDSFPEPKRKLQEALKQLFYNIAHRVAHMYSQYNYDSRDDEVEHFICRFLAMESLYWLKGNWNACPLSNLCPELIEYEDLKVLFPCEAADDQALYKMHKQYNAERDLPALLYHRHYLQGKSILDEKRYTADYPTSGCIKDLCRKFS